MLNEFNRLRLQQAMAGHGGAMTGAVARGAFAVPREFGLGGAELSGFTQMMQQQQQRQQTPGGFDFNQMMPYMAPFMAQYFSQFQPQAQGMLPSTQQAQVF
jgi:hypothetical protein